MKTHEVQYVSHAGGIWTGLIGSRSFVSAGASMKGEVVSYCLVN